MQASISRRSKGVGEGSKSDLGVKVVNKIVEMIKGHTMLVKYFPVPGVSAPPENISGVL